MFTIRGLKILRYIIESNNKTTIETLAHKFKLGERSIRYDIENINDSLKSEGLPLIEKMSKGRLQLTNSKAIENYLSTIKTFQYSIESRKKIIINKIALNGEINLTSISKELDVSRSSVKKDIEELKILLNTYDLKLVINHKKGLLLNGQEKDIRRLQLKVLIENIDTSAVESVLIDPILQDFYKDLNLKRIENFIFDVQKDINIIISDEAYNILKLYIIIAIIRTIDEKTLKEVENESFLASTDEFIAIEKNKYQLENYYGIKLNRIELLKITDLFIGSHSYNFSQSYYDNWFEIEVLVRNLIDNFSKTYGLNLSNDMDLFKGLITHLKPTIYRIQNNIKLHSSVYEDVVEMYPKIYEITSIILKNVESFIGKEFDKDEIAFLAIHFKASIDRNKYKLKINKNILLVCGQGYGTSKLIHQQLKENYGVNIIDSIPFHYVDKYNEMDKVDLIITTSHSPFPKMSKPIVKVNAILKQEDFDILDKNNLPKVKNKLKLSKIVEIVDSNSKVENYDNLVETLKDNMGDLVIDDLQKNKPNIINLLPKENINLNVSASDWESAIHQAGNILVENRFVKESYRESLVKSFYEFGSYMIIDEGIAIPHAKNKNDVIKTGFSLITLKNEVTCPDGKSLKVIFAFSSFDNDEHLEALMNIANLVIDYNFKDAICKMNTPDEVLEFISTHKTSQIS